jgi:hypothetical protein
MPAPVNSNVMHTRARITLNCAVVAAIASLVFYATMYFDVFLWRFGWHPMYMVNSKSGLLPYHTAIAFGYATLRFGVFGFIAASIIYQLRPKALLVYCLVAVITSAYFLEVWKFGIHVPAIYWVYLATIPLFCVIFSFSRRRKVGA